MVSIKVKFRSPAKTGDKGTIYYQITYKQKTRRISSGHRIYPHQWDNKRFIYRQIITHVMARRIARRQKNFIKKNVKNFLACFELYHYICL